MSPSHCSSDDFTSKSGSSIQHRATHCSSRSPLYRLWCLHFNLGLRHRATHCLVVERHISSLLFSPERYIHHHHERRHRHRVLLGSSATSTKSRFHHQASAQSSREPLSSFHPSSSSWTFDVISTIVVSSIYSSHLIYSCPSHTWPFKLRAISTILILNHLFACMTTLCKCCVCKSVTNKITKREYFLSCILLPVQPCFLVVKLKRELCCVISEHAFTIFIHNTHTHTYLYKPNMRNHFPPWLNVLSVWLLIQLILLSFSSPSLHDWMSLLSLNTDARDFEWASYTWCGGCSFDICIWMKSQRLWMCTIFLHSCCKITWWCKKIKQNWVKYKYTKRYFHTKGRRVGSVGKASVCRTKDPGFDSHPSGWLKPALCVNVPLPLFIDAGCVKWKTLRPSARTLNGGPV